MANILTLNAISPVGLERFPKPQYEVGPKVGAPDAILVRSQNMHEMDIPASVKAIVSGGHEIVAHAYAQEIIPAALTPEQYGQVEHAGLGYRSQVKPDDELGHSLFTGPTPFGVVDVPMPKATVAVITTPSSCWKASWLASRTDLSRPAW